MQREDFMRYALRWFMNGLGLWAAASIVSGISYDTTATIVIAALVFSIINAILKPVIVILSLPAIVLTLGLFMLVVNALMINLTHVLYPAFFVADFTAALLAAIIVGLVNYILSMFVDDKRLYVNTNSNNRE